MDNFNNNEDEALTSENELVNNNEITANALIEIDEMENLISAKKEELQEYFSSKNNLDNESNLEKNLYNLDEEIKFEENAFKVESELLEDNTENDNDNLENNSLSNESIESGDGNQILETDLSDNETLETEDDEMQEYNDIDSIIESLNAAYEIEDETMVDNYPKKENTDKINKENDNAEETISDEREDDIEEIVKLLSAKFGNKKYENQFLKDDEEIKENVLDNKIEEPKEAFKEENVSAFEEIDAKEINEEPKTSATEGTSEEPEVLNYEDFIENNTQTSESLDAEGSFIYIDSIRYLIDNQIEEFKENIAFASEKDTKEKVNFVHNQENLDNFVISDDELGLVIDEIFGKKEDEDLSETDKIIAESEIIEDNQENETNEDVLISEDNLQDEESLENDINELLDIYSKKEECTESENEIIESDSENENNLNENQTLDNKLAEDIEKEIIQGTETGNLENVTAETDDINEKTNEEISSSDKISEDDTISFLSRGEIEFTYDTIKESTLENSENIEEVQNYIISEEDTLSYLTIDGIGDFTFVSLDGSNSLENNKEVENNVFEISEEDTIKYFDSEISFETINLSENTFNLPSKVSSEALGQEVKEEQQEKEEPKEPENELIIDPTKAFIPADEIYLKQSQIEPKIKKYFIGKNIAYIMSILSLIATICYIIVISCKGNFASNYFSYIKNLIILIVVFTIFVFMFKTLRERFDDRNSKVFTMLQSFKEYKPVNNYKDGVMFENRVKAVKDYLTLDLFIYILSLVFVVIFAVPFITIAGKNYSLLDCTVDCIKKFFIYEVDNFKFLVSSSPEGQAPNIATVYSSGASKAISDVIIKMFSSSSKLTFIICSIFSFLFIIFMATMIVITIKNIFFQVIYLLDCKHKIKLQELDYRQYEFRGKNAFVSRLINGIIFGMAFAIIMTLFVFMNVVEDSNIIILLILTVLLIVIVTLFVLKKKLFKDTVTLDSGLWFFPRYRQWIRFKYRKQIYKDAKDTFARDYDEYIEEKKRIEREKLEGSKAYKIKTKTKKIFKIVLLLVTLVAIIYIVFSFMDFLGMFHIGKYIREDDGTKYITLEKVGKVTSIDETMTINIPADLEGDITYKVFANEVIIYKNNEKVISATFKDNIIYYNVDNIESVEEGDYITYVYKKEKLSGMQKFYSKVRVIFFPISKVYKFMSFS